MRRLPVLIGEGISFFEKLDTDIALHLAEVKAYKSGMVALRYEVKGREALIVAALAALWGAYLYFQHRERQQRVEIIHQERLAAMEKGIPLPELPLDPARAKTLPDPRVPLLHGIAWTALGLGGVVALFLVPTTARIWPLALPLLFLGLGLILYYAIGSTRTR